MLFLGWCLRLASFLDVIFLTNGQYFDQTCTDTLLGGRKEFIRFGDLDLIFKVIAVLLNVQNIVSACCLLN